MNLLTQLRSSFLILDFRFPIYGSATPLQRRGQRRLLVHRSLGEGGSSTHEVRLARRDGSETANRQSKIGNRQYVANLKRLHDYGTQNGEKRKWKELRSTAILILSSLVLAGCVSRNGKPEDKPLSSTQIEMSLSRTRSPQQFGFQIFAVQGGGIAYSGRGRLHPRHFTSAEMLEENIPVIRMRGRSKRNRMNVLMDVSSPVSWMEFSASQDFNAYFMGINDEVFPYRGSYNTGGIYAFAAVVTQMRIDNLFIENMPFYIRMAKGSLGPLARGIIEPEIDAIIGYDNLRSFEYIQFDLQDNMINFSASDPYTPNPDLLVDVAKIIKTPGHGLAIEGKIDGQPTPIILDFAGDFSLARGDIKVATTRLIHMGHLSLHDVPTLVLPIHTAPPRVGRKLLAPYLITICNREGLVYFEQIPTEE